MNNSVCKKKGSSSFTGEGMLNLEEEVFGISEAVCISFDDLDFVIHAFEDARIEAMIKNA